MRILRWQQGTPLPFRWFRNLVDAEQELEVRERKMTTDPIKKPRVDRPIYHSQPTDIGGLPAEKDSRAELHKVMPVDVQKIATEVATKVGGPEVAKVVQTMDRQQLNKAAQVGQELIRQGGSSRWELAKTVFLGYLSLAALVKGAPGLAALIIGYLAVKGVMYMRSRPNQANQQANQQ